MTASTRPQLHVTVPSDPRYVRVLRVMSNRAAELAGLRFDRIEDLDLAIDEASAALIARGSERLSARIGHTPGEVDVEIDGGRRLEGWPPDDADESLGAIVLEAVTDTVRYDDEPVSSVSFRVSSG